MQITSSSIVRLSAVVGVLTALAAMAPLAGAATKIYMTTWESGSSAGGVRVWTVGAPSSTLLSTRAAGANMSAMGVAVDATRGHVYSVGQDNNQMGYVDRASASDGSDVTRVWTTSVAGYATDLIVDGGSQLAYWGFADGGTPAIDAGSIIGSTLSPSASTPSAVASPILALNSANSYLYWANSSTGNPNIDRALAPALPSRTSFTNNNAANNNMQSLVSNRAGTTMYSATCATRATLGSNPTCTGDVYSKLVSASTATAPASTGQSITGLSALAVGSDDCVYYGTASGVIGTLNLNGCTAAALLTLPATTRISSLWIVESPSATAAPTIIGTPATGSTLTCSDATWSADVLGARASRLPTAARTYQWYLDGSAIAGATGSTHTASAVGSYTCDVTATNVAGSGTSATSAAISVTTPTSTTTSAPAESTTKTYPKIKITWKLKARKLTGTFKAVAGATSYTLVGTGATKKSGSCKTSGAGAKKKVTCTLKLKKGTTTVTVTAKSKAKAILAQTVATKKAT